jgi:hypothetical protein
VVPGQVRAWHIGSSVDDPALLSSTCTLTLGIQCWGEIEWRQVRGVPHEIKVSKKKAAFIEERLPALVGGDAFWMDTITVNQRDQAEVIDTVQSIPGHLS